MVSVMKPETTEPLVIVNSGQLIAQTNYWDSEMALNGFIYLSWNAGVARILVPDKLNSYVREMRTGKYCILSQGPWLATDNFSMELLFEDKTSCPFSVQISPGQTDRVNACAHKDEGFFVTVWTRDGMQLRMPAKFRKVDALPFLLPWAH